ncbi:hypothetical protein BJY01DRAFT_256375 [Aspergillus pseudoustus]|uniref:Uncharacterized protein n=1 Tax=Aspergillus pseudoustus TaxID=1810923 RepID=A0ABR4IB65_9EURO
MASSFFDARAPLALKNRHSLLMRRLKRVRPGLEQCGNDGVSPCTTSASVSSTASSKASIIAPPAGGDDLAILQTLGGNEIPSSPPSWGTGTSIRSINTTSATNSNLAWPPPPSTATDHTDMDVEDLMLMSIPDLNWDEIRQSLKPKAVLSASHSVTPNSEFQQTSDGGTAAKCVEYSVTCQRAKLKSLVTHLVAAAMSETADCAAEEDQVTLTLNLKS